MFIIAGLGNPTKKYEHTRHNMGYDCVDLLAEKLGAKFRRSRFASLIAKAKIGNEKVILVKPLTYMNLSGSAVAPLVKYCKANPETSLVVIYDDTDLPVGSIRVRKQGSAGGHNGMKSIISSLGTEGFSRVRIGIGPCPEHTEMADYVLGRFSPDERKLADAAAGRAADAAACIVLGGIDSAMNTYNQRF